VLRAFGDESSDRKKERVFAVAAVFGSDDKWDALRKLWSDRTGGKIFHAADCESDGGDYAGIPHKENQSLYKDLTGILADSGLIGYGMSIDLECERRYFGKALKDGAYQRAFGEVILYFSYLAYLSVPQDRLEFTFDSRLETNFSAGSLYEYLMSHREWQPSQYLYDAVKFVNRRETGIQVADLWAREVMKDMDNDFLGRNRRAPRASLSRLIATTRFHKKMLREDYFKKTHELISKIDATDSTSPFFGTKYKDWMRQVGVTDSHSARLRYIGQYDAIAKAKGDLTYFEHMQRWNTPWDTPNLPG